LEQTAGGHTTKFRDMITKILIIVAIPLLLGGYARYEWHADQQRWAAAREAAEVRYWDMIELNCQLGEIADSTMCAKAHNILLARVP
jgi:ACR3 family arsenite efflux pump ArsB